MATADHLFEIDFAELIADLGFKTTITGEYIHIEFPEMEISIN